MIFQEDFGDFLRDEQLKKKSCGNNHESCVCSLVFWAETIMPWGNG